MKSLQVAAIYKAEDPDLARYSDLQVMRSGAGWYIGTSFSNPEGFAEPGSRDTDYYASEADAKYALDTLERCLAVRDGYTPEKKLEMWADMMFLLDLDKRNVGYRMQP